MIQTVRLDGAGLSRIWVQEGQHHMKNRLILDMIMPEMGGGELYDRLKRINPGLKAILSSGYSIDGKASEIMARGCNGFIQKPFDLKRLSAKVSEIIDG